MSRATRTVLLGLDGATFTILDPLMRDGVMPFMKGLVDSGVRGTLQSIVPPLTPPAWTSLMTGRTPGYHGIFDFFQPESADSKYLRFASASDVHSETIWSILTRHGLSATALNFPLMFPPRPINGYVVPGGWMPWKQLRLACYPSDLYDRLKALPGFNAREVAMDMGVEEKAIEGCRDEEYADWITFHIRREEHWFEIARYLMRENPCDLTAVMFDGVDKLQHLCWTYLDPAYAGAITTEQQQQIRTLCRTYFNHLDTILAGIVEAAGPDPTVVVASDHGFGPNYEVFYVNSWLEHNGYLAWAEGHESNSGDAVLGMTDLTRYIYRLDWSKTTAYATTPSANGIHIARATEPDGPGIAEADYERFRAELIARLAELKAPGTDERVVVGIATREEAFPGPHGAIGPDLTLALRDGGLVSILPAPGDGAVVQPRAKHGGSHRPEGVFIASGAGIRHGSDAGTLSILDIAPILLYSLGLPIPTTMEGHMPEDIFDPARLENQPVSQEVSTEGQEPAATPTTATDEASGGATVHPVFDAQAEAEVMARLRALGYVE